MMNATHAHHSVPLRLAAVPVVVLMAIGPAVALAESPGTSGSLDDRAAGDWVTLSESLGPERWRQPTGTWFLAGRATIAPDNARRLAGSPGDGVLINGSTGRTSNLLTVDEFGDVELHCEFMVPENSNAGIKFHAVYEIQIYDSYGEENPTASDCGGIYHRAELFPRYHHIDRGYPPLVNASQPPGTWQTLDIVFRAPRFDAQGVKIANARIVRAVLNGQLVQDDVELATPTGNNWTLSEVAAGPILLQADHGPVALRNLRVRSLDLESD